MLSMGEPLASVVTGVVAGVEVGVGVVGGLKFALGLETGSVLITGTLSEGRGRLG